MSFYFILHYKYENVNIYIFYISYRIWSFSGNERKDFCTFSAVKFEIIKITLFSSLLYTKDKFAFLDQILQ